MNLSGRTIGSRYRLYDRIREDRYGVTYHAAVDGAPEATRLVTIYDGEAVSRRVDDVIRFKADTRKILGAAHDHCLAVDDRGSIFDYCYVVTAPCEGPTLADLLRDGGPLPAIITLARDLADGLAFLHARGVVLRNLSPENIVITPTGAVIINPGAANLFTTSPGLDRSSLIELAMYIAPEQTGLTNRSEDERSDLFTLGVILRRVVTGQDTFRGDDLSTTLYRIVTLEPSAAELSGLPSTLATIIDKLMAKDPDERYQGANGLAADLESLAAGNEDLVPGAAEGPSAPRFHAELTGRADEQALLASRLDEALEGRGSLCVITGTPGSGKSRLAEELLVRAAARGITALSAKCNEGFESAPHAAAGEILAAWMRTYHTLADGERMSLDESLRHSLGDMAGLLSSIHPAIEEIMGHGPAPGGMGEKTESLRFHDTAARFFLALAAVRGGLVLFIDDIQWCDEGTLAIAGVLLEAMTEHRLLFIVTSRDDAPSSSRRLASLRAAASGLALPTAEITALPLDENHTRTLVRRMLGAVTPVIDEAAAFVHRRAGGNALSTITLLRALADKGLLRRDSERWAFDETTAERGGVPGSQLEIIMARLDSLGPDDTRTLARAAAIGREFSLVELFGVCGGDKDDVMSTVDHALSLQVLAPWRNQRNTCIFAHDRIREALYQSTTTGERTETHRAIARFLETQEPGDRRDYELTRHYLRAGNRAAFLEHAVAAAARARERYDYDDARSLLQSARDIPDDPDLTRRDHIQAELGTIALITGDFGAAIDAFTDLAPRQANPVTRAGTLAGLAEARYRRGEWEACESAARDGLRLLDHRLPAGTTHLLMASAKELVRLLLSMLFMTRRSPVLRARPADQAALDIYKSLLQNYLFNNDGLRFVHTSLRMAVIAAIRMGPSKELSTSLLGVGLIFSAMARFGLARRIISRARTISVATADRWGEAQALGLGGLLCEFTGRYSLGIDRYYRRSALIFTEVGDIKNLGIVHIGLAQCYLFRADYAAALRHTGESHRIAQKIGDLFFTGMSLVYFARAYRKTGDRNAAGDYTARALAFNREHALWQNYCASLIEHACLLLDEGDAPGAITALEEARDLDARSTFSPQHVIQLHAHLAEAYLSDLGARGRHLPRREQRRRERQVRTAAGRALKLGRQWVSHQGMAWRVLAAWQAHTGHLSASERSLRRAIDHCRTLDNRHELARSCYEFSLLLMQLHRAAEAREYLESAYLLYREIGARDGAAQCGSILGVSEDSDDGASLNRLARLERRQALRDMTSAMLADDAIWNDATRIVDRIVQATGARGGYLFIEDGSKLQPLYGTTPNGHGDWGLACRAVTTVQHGTAKSPLWLDNNDSTTTRHAVVTACYIIPLAPTPILSGFCCLMAPLFVDDLAPDDTTSLTDILSHTLFLLAGHRPGSSPLSDKRSHLTESAHAKIDQAIAYIQEHYHTEISREGLAAHLDLSPNYFSKIFRDYSGRKISEYINDLRLEQAMIRLKDTDERIIDIAFAVGYENLRTFNRAFQKKNEIQPQRYRELYRHKP